MQVAALEIQLFLPNPCGMDQAHNKSIELTAAAAAHIADYLSRNQGAGLRLGVKKTGCSGWGYVVELAEEITDADRVFDSQGVRVVVDGEALGLVGGTTIDFVKEGLNSHLVFRNPNVTDECGCGESFAVAPPGGSSFVPMVED